MSLPAYVINWQELKDILSDKLSNVIVKDLSSLQGVHRTKGFYIKVPAIKSAFTIVKFQQNTNLVMTGVTFAQSGWKAEDYWELYIGGEKHFETIFTKEVATEKNWQVIEPIDKNTEIKLVLHNNSGNSRDVWVDLDFIELRDTIPIT